MRTITPRYPLQRDSRIVVGVELDMSASQCNTLIDAAESKGKFLGIHVISAALGAGALYGFQWAKKNGKI